MKNPIRYVWYYLIKKIYHHINEMQVAEEEKKQKQLYDNTINSFKHIGCNSRFIYNDFLIRGAKYISIGDHFMALRHFRIEAIDEYEYSNQYFSPQILIGNNVSIQDFCHIGCINKIEIGNDVMIASKVFITDHFHGNISEQDLNIPPIKRSLSSKPVKIGNKVWIGDNVSILPGVSLGNNIIIGANAVVTHSFPDNCVIAGCPAKIIKVIC